MEELLNKKLWFTYAWDDNKDGAVDFITQQIRDAGVEVHLDRWNLVAGERLWTQIESNITDPNLCDAWAIYLTQNSLNSKSCQEELYYALDRALTTRGSHFPLFALVDTDVETSLIPRALKIRLYISLDDNDWIGRINSAVNSEVPTIEKPRIEPFKYSLHSMDDGILVIEVRPVIGSWMPFIIAIPLAEAAQVLRNPEKLNNISVGPTGGPPMASSVSGVVFGESKIGNREVRYWSIQTVINKKTSFYLEVLKLPSEIWFGQNSGGQLYNLKLR